MQTSGVFVFGSAGVINLTIMTRVLGTGEQLMTVEVERKTL